MTRPHKSTRQIIKVNHRIFINAHPEYFRLENAPRNRGHLDEKPGRNDIEDIVDKMQAFIKQER